MKRDNKILTEAVFISFAIHLAFLACSPWIFLAGPPEKEKPREFFRLRTIDENKTETRKHDKLPPDPTGKPKIPAVRMSRQGIKTTSSVMKNMMLGENAQKDIDLDNKKKKLRTENFDRLVREDDPIDHDIMGVEYGKTNKDAAPQGKTLLKQSPDGIKSAPSGEPMRLKSMDYKIDRKGFSWANVVIDINNALGKGKNKLGGPGGGAEIGRYDFNGIQGERDQIGDFDDIDQFLDIKLYRYADNVSGDKYFKLTIKAKEGISFKVMPKELIFLLDSSKSITQEKLEYLKVALISSLRYRNKGDRFNVIAFRENPVRFKDKSVEMTDKNIMEAVSFIKGLEAVGQTDVNKALLGIVGTRPAYYPSYILLMSDGRPTMGVTNSRNIIQELTRHNNMDRPVFTFGGGGRVNRYLLDFIAYQNRGWSQFADRIFTISDEFQTLYREIKDPLFLNVRYRLINMDERDVYPKYLPDFYRGKEMVLYGKYTDEDVFSMQLLGEIDEETKELIMEKALSKAEPGGADIAREWAFNKIYYLISLDSMGMGDHETLKQQIYELSRRYSIVTPYDLEQKD